MLKVIPLRYGTIFKRAFGDREVFNRFASDVLDMPIDVGVVQTEYRYPEAVGRVNVEYDLFGEDVAHRVIVEVQHIREEDFFDRFLHYHIVSIAEQATSHAQYRVGRDVYTLVMLTTEPREKSLRFSVAISDMDPISELGKRLGVYRHRMVFLNPRVINESTPAKVRPWLELIADSLDGEVDDSRYLDPTLRRAMFAAETRTVSPDDLARIKDEAAWEATKAGARAEGVEEGRREGLRLIVRVFERKLGRALTADEREALAARFDSLGAEVIGDVAVDLDAPALAAWLRAG